LLRAGINGAFVDQRGIYTTSRGVPLESGHIPIDLHGHPCTCGTGGCLESHIHALDKANARAGQPLFKGLEERIAAGDNSAKIITAKAAGYLFFVTKSIMRFLSPRSFLILANGTQLSSNIAENIRKCWAKESDIFISEKPRIFSHSYNTLAAQRGASYLVISYYFSTV
jgi:predicted NBD/HSP70 family sugar kinase